MPSFIEDKQRAASWRQRLAVACMAGYAKPFLLGLGLLPAVVLVTQAFVNALGANPAEALIRSTGDWALRMLCVALAVTPLRVITGVPVLGRFRRMFGLLVYFYAATHLLAYAWLDNAFDFNEILKDVLKRPFIFAGMLAFVLLTPLALTSWDGAVRRLGGRAWRRLHKLVFAIAGLTVLHFFWMRSGKHDYGEVIVYACALGGLLLWRFKRYQAAKMAA